jgi:hypothetical protein
MSTRRLRPLRAPAGILPEQGRGLQGMRAQSMTGHKKGGCNFAAALKKEPGTNQNLMRMPDCNCQRETGWSLLLVGTGSSVAGVKV